MRRRRPVGSNLPRALTEMEGQILGLGARHPLGDGDEADLLRQPGQVRTRTGR